MTFATHMRGLRGNLTQSAFCRKLGIPLTTYQRYEKGERVPDINVFSQVVRAVGISADTLLGLNPFHSTQDPEKMSNDSSCQRLMDKKDIIIVHQGEAIDAMSYALKMLA